MVDTNQEQFSLIYDQYIEKIYRFVYLKVSSKEVAQDVASRVFIKAWEALQKGQAFHNPGAFLYKIARNMVIDHYRQKDRSKTVSLDSVAQVSDPGINIYEKAVVNHQMESVVAAIRRLKGDYQDILIWYYLEDMSADHIAQVLDKPAGTVRVLIHRALESLKQELQVISS